jgi:hypothetical protein
VPFKSQDYEDLVTEFSRRAQGGDRFFLPVVSIVETGNHIARIENGRRRRQVAETFVARVKAAIDGESPFTLTSPLDREIIGARIEDFIEWATREIGIGDVLIVAERDRLRPLLKPHSVEVWSLDSHFEVIR